jgi:peptidoglycan/LPS O-acetylase OafA/YrhL
VRQNLTALNGLRIFAAAVVIGFHYGMLTESFSRLPHFLQNVVGNGTIALPFFYLLSGFVLTHAYAGRIATPRQKRDFYLARFARLYPAYLLSFVLFLPIAVEKYLRHPAISQHHGPRTFVLGGALTFFAVQAWTSLSQAWNGPGWSLSVEAFFYFAFPLVLPRMVRMRSAPLVTALGILWLAMLSFTVAHEHNLIGAQIWYGYVLYQPLLWTPMFLLGMATYRLASKWSQVPDAVATLVSVVSLAALVVLCGLPPVEGGNLFVNGGAAPLIALVVLAYSHPRSLSSRVMGASVLSFLGGMSYLVYILQAPLWHMFRAVTDKLRHVHGQGTVKDWQFLLYLPLLLGFAFAVQRLVEKPAQQWLLSRRRQAAAKTEDGASRVLAA